MVERIQQTISEYQQQIAEIPYRPTALGINGGVNLVFLTFLFSDKGLGTQILKDLG